jgi:hypothetical protein
MTMAGRPRTPYIHKRTIVLVMGEATDQAAENMSSIAMREFVGMDAGPRVSGDPRNVLITADGAELVTGLPLQRAPVPSGADLAYDEAETEDTVDLNSQPGTSSLLIGRIPGVSGIVVAVVCNGNGENFRGDWAGYQGFVSGLFQFEDIGIVDAPGVQAMSYNGYNQPFGP